MSSLRPAQLITFRIAFKQSPFGNCLPDKSVCAAAKSFPAGGNYEKEMGTSCWCCIQQVSPEQHVAKDAGNISICACADAPSRSCLSRTPSLFRSDLSLVEQFIMALGLRLGVITLLPFSLHYFALIRANFCFTVALRKMWGLL